MSARTGNGVLDPVSPGQNAFAASPAPSPSGSKATRPSGSSSSKSRQRTIRENAKPRVDNSADGGLASPIVADDCGSNQQGDRRSSEEVETGERWKGRVSPQPIAVVAPELSGSIPASSPATTPQTPIDYAGTNGHGAIPPSSGSKSGRRHVRDTSANGMEKEMSSDNLGDVVSSSSQNRAGDEVENTAKRSQSGKADTDIAKRDGDSEMICSWLAQLGLSQYASNFLAHHVTTSNLEELDKEALQLIGVSSWGHRCVILKSVARLKESNAGPTDEETAAQGARGSGPGGRKRGGERDRSATTPVAGVTAILDSHDNLKNVYEQIENMKMHFEAQMEQLNRELMATKAELVSVKGALAAQQASTNANGGSGSAGGRKGGSGGGHSEGEGKNGAGVNRNGKQQQRRKDNAPDAAAEGNGGTGYPFNSQQQGMGGQVPNAQYMRPVAQAGMTYGQPVYANMMHPGAQQYYYGSLGMGMGTGYEGYDASAGQYYIQPVMQQQQAMQGVAGGVDGYGNFEGGGMMPVQMGGMQAGGGEAGAEGGGSGSNGVAEGGESSGGM